MIDQALQSRIRYYKRFRMEIELPSYLAEMPSLPPGFFFIAWDEGLMTTHAEVKYRCFSDEIDALVFPSLGTRAGCSRLMNDIRRRPGFCPEATWLIADSMGACATIQGVLELGGWGAVQNVGVAPGYRGRGLGQCLILQALLGFRRAGARRVHLEVTAQNEGALRLYRRLGFRCRKTIYKSVDAFPAPDLPDWFL